LLGFVVVIGAADRAAAALGHPAQSGNRRDHGRVAVHERPHHPDQPAVPVVGYAYGRGAGTIANVTAAIGLIVKTWSNLAGMIFLLFVIANFIAFFNYTNLATVLAVNLADFLQTTALGPRPTSSCSCWSWRSSTSS
jgi:hypothetical protein